MKNAAITARLVALMAEGQDVRQAWETVFGAGSWETMAGEIYDALRARGAK